MSSWASTGWDQVEDYESSSATASSTREPWRFRMRAEETKRIMFLDNDPFCFYEHSLWAITGRGDRAICLAKNRIDDRGCPLCEKELWPSFIGYFTVIDLGYVSYEGDAVKLAPYVTKAGAEIQFDRKLFGAKRGGKDKPGVLKKLQRLRSKHGGSLIGTVWDVYRSGAKTEAIGDEFEFVEAVHEGDFSEFLLGQGANAEYMGLDPFDYADIFKPMSHEQLANLAGTGGDDVDEGSGARVDDEVPF